MQHLEHDQLIIKRASQAALASLLNLTFLPVIGFIFLLIRFRTSNSHQLDHYYCVIGIKLNVLAAILLFIGSMAMILTGGFHSPWTWVYVLTYFTLVHSLFIVVAVWSMIRAWSGKKLRS